MTEGQFMPKAIHGAANSFLTTAVAAIRANVTLDPIRGSVTLHPVRASVTLAFHFSNLKHRRFKAWHYPPKIGGCLVHIPQIFIHFSGYT